MTEPTPRAAWRFLTLLAALAAAAPAQDETVIVCQQGPTLEVRLRCRAVATAADRDWLQLEFDNKTNVPLRLQGCTWSLDWAEVHDAAGTLLCTHSGLGQGSDHDLFPRPRPQDPIDLAPGVTRIAAPISDYATALLQVADAPCRVTPHVVATAALVGEAIVASAEPGPTFSFRWLPPDADGVRRMRATLAELLPQPQPVIGSLYLVGMLLQRPEVGGIWSLGELLALWNPAQHNASFAPWTMVLPHLDSRFAADPKLQEWVLQRLRSDDATILEDLQRMPHVWRADFLPELMRRYVVPASPHAFGPRVFANDRVLWLLEQRGAPQRGDAATCAALAAPWIEALGATTPVELDGLPVEARRERVRQLHAAITNLGLARDSGQIERLRPWLACRTHLYADERFRSHLLTSPPEPRRLCDVAADALLRVIGADLAADYQKHCGAGYVVAYDPAVRDRQIAALQELLRQRR